MLGKRTFTHRSFGNSGQAHRLHEFGAECLIAAGTLVTEGRRIPPRSVVMGVPGKVVRAVTDEELERTRMICAHYLEMAQRYVRGAYPPPWTR